MSKVRGKIYSHNWTETYQKYLGETSFINKKQILQDFSQFRHRRSQKQSVATRETWQTNSHQRNVNEKFIK